MSYKTTQGPWKVRINKTEVDIVGADGSVVAFVGVIDKDIRTETKADAQLIVRAVNNHEELVKQLRASLNFITKPAIFDSFMETLRKADGGR